MHAMIIPHLIAGYLVVAAAPFVGYPEAVSTETYQDMFSCPSAAQRIRSPPSHHRFD